MPNQRCPSCSTTVPLASYCPSCGEPISDIGVPSPTTDPETLTTRLSTVAGKANHDTVSFDALRTDYEKYDRPLGDYLSEREHPVALFESAGVAVEDFDEKTWKITAGFRKSGHLVLTDERLFVLLPRDSSDSGADSLTADQFVPIEYSDTVTVAYESSWRKDRIRLETADGYTYTIRLSGVTDEELAETAGTLRELAHESDSADSRAARFIRDVDDAVADGETAEALLREVADLFARRDEETMFDSAVAEAESLDELFAALQRTPGLMVDRDQALESQVLDMPPTPQQRIGTVRQHVAHTLANADPAEVGKYTVAAGVGFGAYAVTAPFSTVAGLAAIAAGGAATGAYASSHPDSVLARIDPVTLATRARVQGRKWEGSSIPGTGGAGAALGALEYIAEEEVPQEYAHWIANADLDTVRRGAELGIQASATREDVDSPASAAMLGGGIGLAYGYMNEEDRLDEPDRLLDDDLTDSIHLEELDETDSGE